LSYLPFNEQLPQVEDPIRNDDISDVPAQSPVNWKTLPFFSELVSRPYLFKNIIRMSLDEFEELASELCPIIESRSIDGRPKKFSRTLKYPPILRLITTLTYLAIYPTQKLFSAMLGVTEWTLIEWVEHVLNATREWANSKIMWPSDDKMVLEQEVGGADV
jgi:hypothetical protein